MKKPNASLTAKANDFDREHPFYGKVAVFTGELRSMIRREAMQLILDHGGQIADALKKNTGFLVVGDFDFRKFRSGDKSSKLIKAEALKKAGAEIEILSEDEWLQLLDPALVQATAKRPNRRKARGADQSGAGVKTGAAKELSLEEILGPELTELLDTVVKGGLKKL
jgi:BRCT domain type II-containing protein